MNRRENVGFRRAPNSNAPAQGRPIKYRKYENPNMQRNNNNEYHKARNTGKNPSKDRNNQSAKRSMNAIHISKNFSYEKQKYSGGDDESYNEKMHKYITLLRGLNLSASERFQFLHYLFDGVALNFYCENGKDRDANEATNVIKEMFHSVGKQQQVKSELSQLRFSIFTSEGKVV